MEQLVKKSTSVLDLSRVKISDHYIADVAESADALASGASPRKGVWVQVPSSAPNKKSEKNLMPASNRGHKTFSFLAIIMNLELFMSYLNYQ